METLVVVSHRNQCYSRGGASRISDGFGSSPSRGFRAINCRTFHSGMGILPCPSPVIPSFTSPTVVKHTSYYSEPPKQTRRSSLITISPKLLTRRFSTFADDLTTDSELWAGPAYSNSPPPSCLPIPKFSLHKRHNISLELPAHGSEMKVQPTMKSAPSSPTGKSYLSANDFFLSTDSATQSLRRILHLDMAGE